MNAFKVDTLQNWPCLTGMNLLARGNVKQNRAMLLHQHLIGSAQALNALVAAREKLTTVVKRQLQNQTGMRQPVITYVNRKPTLNVNQSTQNSFGGKHLATAVVTQQKQMQNALQITNLAISGLLTNADVQLM